ncbi:TIGR04076 family protein [Candidatus Bathyarchaeota archaeon]|nr:MAG: TIGR04076 family protein [Candidatus Bathyarchaeota archaeon]
MSRFEVEVVVEEVRGCCAAYYKPGDFFVVREFYILEDQKTKICLHALSSMLTLLMPFLKGVSAKDLGIGSTDDIGYVQCPDPGQPYTCGGSVLFKLRRIKTNDVRDE